VATSTDTLAKVDLCANLALQYARLGYRTLIVDLDARLPNVGFRLGLEPRDHLAHLHQDAVARVRRAPLGVRIVEGIACDHMLRVSEEVVQEWQEAQCVLVNLPVEVTSLHRLLTMFGEGPHDAAGVDPPTSKPTPPRRALGRTTMARAGASSRMFGAWLETAHRAPRSQDVRGDRPLDAVLFVQQEASDLRTQEGMRAWREALDPVTVHLLRCAAEAEAPGDSARPAAWATWIHPPALTAVRQPLSLLYPEHEASRRLEGLAQSLLASSSRQGGAHVRTL
jgi:hypothetical protein